MSKIFLFQTIQFSQTVLIQTIQFSICTQFSSILSIDRARSGATTPGQSGLGSNDNEGMFFSAEVQSVYSTAPADWAMYRVKCKNNFISDNSVKHKYTV